MLEYTNNNRFWASDWRQYLYSVALVGYTKFALFLWSAGRTPLYREDKLGPSLCFLEDGNVYRSLR